MMGCSNKVWFKSKKIAREKKKGIENKFNKKIRIYKCKNCGGFHYTNQVSIKKKIFFRTYFINN
jgi:hypothetical protein